MGEQVRSADLLVAREGLTLLVGLPLALIGLGFWYPPYALNKLIVSRLDVEETGIATYKLGLSMLIMPLTLIIWSVVAFDTFGWRGLAVALIGLPLIALRRLLEQVGLPVP